MHPAGKSAKPEEHNDDAMSTGNDGSVSENSVASSSSSSSAVAATQNANNTAAASSSASAVASSSSSSSSSSDHASSTSARQARDPFEAPCRKLSYSLIKTYKHINAVYYEKRRKRKAQKAKAKQYNDGHDDQHYDYKLIENEVLNDRYKVEERIGKGSFGQVVRAFDQRLQTHVAIKIVKSKRAFFQQARTEIDLLEFLNRHDKGDQFNIVNLTDTFVHHRHQCLVFELLACNLYELLRNTRFLGVSFNLIRKFGKQILKCLSFLAAPEINVIHCDLKPENILLRDPQRSAIKVIDFGSSCHGDKCVYTYIQSRFYRSPEVMLGLEYGVQIDMWSLGCILVEMHTGEPLFNGTDEFDQMHRVCSLFGLPPEHMIANAKPGKRKTFFVQVEEKEQLADAASQSEGGGGSSSSSSAASSNGGSGAGSDNNAAMDVDDDEDGKESGVVRMVWRLRKRRPDTTPGGKGQDEKVEVITNYPNRTLDTVLGVETGGPGGRRKGEDGHSPEKYRLFRDLVNVRADGKCLEFFQNRRGCGPRRELGIELCDQVAVRIHAKGPAGRALGAKLGTERANRAHFAAADGAQVPRHGRRARL